MLKIDEVLKAPKGVSIDSRTLKQGDLFIAIKGDKFDGHNFIEEAIKKGAKAVVVESLKSKVESYKKINVIKVKDTVRALGDIAKYWRRQFNIPVVCITGSNGKTTTKDMIAWVLSAEFNVLKSEGTMNNHIGLPLTLLGLNKTHDAAVVEIGTNHFGEIKRLSEIAAPNLGVITNIGQSHLESFKGLKGVYKEKSALLKNLTPPWISILNADDPYLNKSLKAHPLNFNLGLSINRDADFRAWDIKRQGQGLEFKVNSGHQFKINTLGRSNIYNALAAISVARIFGIDYKSIRERLSGFEFPAGRLRLRKVDEINFIDDTYNSNPLSLNEALEALSSFEAQGRKIFVMGDMLELGGSAQGCHRGASVKISEACDCLITVGELARLAADAAKRSGLGEKAVFSCATSDQARKILFQRLKPGEKDIVLVKGSRAMKMEEIFKSNAV